MITEYISEDGDVWIERGAGPWPRIQRAGFGMLEDLGWGPPEYRRRYVGIEKDVRVSDEQEYTHGDDDACADAQDKNADDPTFVPCCRTIEAHHFIGEVP